MAGPDGLANRSKDHTYRYGVYSKWLEAEHVKKSAGSGYAKYGTKQGSIEGALEELNDMISHYNSICGMQKEKRIKRDGCSRFSRLYSVCY